MQKKCSVISIKHKKNKKNTNIDRYENDGKGLFGKIGKFSIGHIKLVSYPQ